MVTGSVMQALQQMFGNVSITDHAYDFRGWAPWTFSPIFIAAEQADISRLYGGIHYHVSIDIGLGMAKIIGTRVGEIQLHDGADGD